MPFQQRAMKIPPGPGSENGAGSGRKKSRKSKSADNKSCSFELLLKNTQDRLEGEIALHLLFFLGYARLLNSKLKLT